MSSLAAAVDTVVRDTGFSGAVRIDRDGATVVEVAAGFADRAHGIPNGVRTRFGVASGAKGLTALAVVSLIVDGTLEPGTTARSLLGSDLPLVADDVTVEHLLAHRSGIGDYLDEDAGGDITDHVLAVPVHELDSTEAYVRVLDGHPTKFAAGARFSYCNGGYVLLALLAERAAGRPFADLVVERVCDPAGMDSTRFLRSDELPGDVAIGYLADGGLRTNALHLPVVGSGDGGIHTTMADVHRLWDAFLAGRIVPARWVEEMTRPRSDLPSLSMRYGLGFWLAPDGPGMRLEGYDAGVSFRSEHDPSTGDTWTVVSNSSDGAWPVARVVAAQLPG
jgi:CubicO group peptidase (beta-lactamase class C family)